MSRAGSRPPAVADGDVAAIPRAWPAGTEPRDDTVETRDRCVGGVDHWAVHPRRHPRSGAPQCTLQRPAGRLDVPGDRAAGPRTRQSRV